MGTRIPYAFRAGLHRFKDEKSDVLCPPCFRRTRMSDGPVGTVRAGNDGDEEFMWVKAGIPGEKPTILRPVRSDGSFDHLQVNQPRVDLARPVSTESCVIVLDVDESYSARNMPALLSSPRLGGRRDEHHSASLGKTDQSKLVCSRQRQLSESRDVNPDCRASSPLVERKSPRSHQALPLNPIQIQRLKASPNAFARHRARELSQFQQAHLAAKIHDDGYTSLSEDAKESDCDRTRSLPSSWRPRLSDNMHEPNLHAFAKRMTSNEQKIDASNPVSSAWCDSSQLPCSSSKPIVNNRPDNCRLLPPTSEEPSERRKTAELVLEYCTCYICLRSAVYHCIEDEDADNLGDHPCDCSLSGKSFCRRWTLIGLMTCFFPFLLCYPPIKGCMNVHDYRLRRKKRRRELKRRRTGDVLGSKLSATKANKAGILQNGKCSNGKSENVGHQRNHSHSVV